MSINENHEILTVPELAERRRVGQKWVYTHVDFLGGYKMGKYIRFNWPTVLERLSAGQRRLSDQFVRQIVIKHVRTHITAVFGFP